MIDPAEIANRIQETLSMMDPDEDRVAYKVLSDYIYDGVVTADVLVIAESFLRSNNHSQIIWDLVIELLELGVEDGNAGAMNNLGAMYYDGTGCEQSFEKAVYYYKMAAAHGDRQAQENLGYCYYYGRNMPVDYEKAFHYFALGAFDGHLISLYKIGDMYANGYYVPQNETEAFHIYERCIDTMTEQAAPLVAGPVYLRLGKAYLYGKGTQADAKKALVCYQTAELYLYDMVKKGDVMYKKSLLAAIEGQARAREKMLQELPAAEWRHD